MPVELPETSALTVSSLTELIKNTLENSFPDVTVLGEVSEFHRAASGHIYLTLKDEKAVLRAIIWRGLARRLKFDLEEGQQVLARGEVDVYPPRGSYQLIIRQVEPRGMGELELAFRQMKERLQKEGLFRDELKQPLPSYPRAIGVVTSATGAAVRDIINTVTGRYPPADIFLRPTRVQGEGSADEIAAAIRDFGRRGPHVDLLIVGRGGGSLEDLWAFNEEVVARAIYESDIPIISAVGHEVDVSISDLVADRRAATPTEAGQMAVPHRDELRDRLRQARRRLALAMRSRLRTARQRLQRAVAGRALRRPQALIGDRAQRADELLDRMNAAMDSKLERLENKLTGTADRLEALSPLRVLERGYSITFDARGDVLRDAEQVRRGDRIRTRLHSGELRSKVMEINSDNDEGSDDE
jgi:exodeoxyribonuclease VII large subunit